VVRDRFPDAREIARGGVSIHRALARAYVPASRTLIDPLSSQSGLGLPSSRLFLSPSCAGGLKALNERTIIEICFPARR